jgi:hypothetical protein
MSLVSGKTFTELGSLLFTVIQPLPFVFLLLKVVDKKF